GDYDVSRPWITGIPMDAIRSALDGIPARQKILLIDTCQSGEVIDITSYQPSKERLEELQKNMVILLQNRYVAMCLSV
ncbi:MAG: hypothetical protein GYA16_00840, partial [Spirochaetes bacterium]|nr:hypothetical protein [Spirochaetota bacterium]